MLDGAVVDKRRLLASLSKSKLVIDELFKSEATQNNILSAITLVLNCFKNGNKLIFVGNGGSAADAQHMSAEYVSRFMFDRPALPSIALTTDTSALTAMGMIMVLTQFFLVNFMRLVMQEMFCLPIRLQGPRLMLFSA